MVRGVVQMDELLVQATHRIRIQFPTSRRCVRSISLRRYSTPTPNPTPISSVLTHSSPSSSQSPSSSPNRNPNLHPTHKVDKYALPLHPSPPPSSLLFQPSSTTTTTSSTTLISRTYLHRLHRLAALNPPAPSSPEETKLLNGLTDLIGLMDQVKSVDLELELASGLGPGPGLGQEGNRDGRPSKEALRKRLLECLWENEDVVIDGSGMEDHQRRREKSKGKKDRKGSRAKSGIGANPDPEGSVEEVDEVYKQEDVISGKELLKWRRPIN